MSPHIGASLVRPGEHMICLGPFLPSPYLLPLVLACSTTCLLTFHHPSPGCATCTSNMCSVSATHPPRGAIVVVSPLPPLASNRFLESFPSRTLSPHLAFPRRTLTYPDVPGRNLMYPTRQICRRTLVQAVRPGEHMFSAQHMSPLPPRPPTYCL